jgi:hypothetical protein
MEIPTLLGPLEKLTSSHRYKFGALILTINNLFLSYSIIFRAPVLKNL